MNYENPSLTRGIQCQRGDKDALKHADELVILEDERLDKSLVEAVAKLLISVPNISLDEEMDYFKEEELIINGRNFKAGLQVQICPDDRKKAIIIRLSIFDHQVDNNFLKMREGSLKPFEICARQSIFDSSQLSVVINSTSRSRNSYANSPKGLSTQ